VAMGTPVSVEVPASTAIHVKLGVNPFGAGKTVYAFDSNLTYLDISKVTDGSSIASFTLTAGLNYHFRTDHSPDRQFFVGPIASESQADLVIPTDTVVHLTQGGVPLGAGKTIYAFDSNGVYLDYSRLTDASSNATFNLPDDGTIYRFRHDFDGQQWFSPTTQSGGNVSLNVPVSTTVFVTVGTAPIGAGQTVYAFDSNQTYLGISKITDSSSFATFTLTSGNSFLFRTDYNPDKQFFTDLTVSESQVNLVIPTSTIVHLTNHGVPMGSGKTIYAFDDSGTYLNYSRLTDASSYAYFNLPDDGTLYKFRHDFNGVQFFSSVPHFSGSTVSLDIPDAYAVTFIDGSTPINNTTVYAFLPDGTYYNLSKVTDSSGTVYFNLPGENSYKFRIDVGGNQHFTPIYQFPGSYTFNISPALLSVSSPYSIEVVASLRNESSGSITPLNIKTVPADFTLPETSGSLHVDLKIGDITLSSSPFNFPVTQINLSLDQAITVKAFSQNQPSPGEFYNYQVQGVNQESQGGFTNTSGVVSFPTLAGQLYTISTPRLGGSDSTSDVVPGSILEFHAPSQKLLVQYPGVRPNSEDMSLCLSNTELSLTCFEIDSTNEIKPSVLPSSYSLSFKLGMKPSYTLSSAFDLERDSLTIVQAPLIKQVLVQKNSSAKASEPVTIDDGIATFTDLTNAYGDVFFYASENTYSISALSVTTSLSPGIHFISINQSVPVTFQSVVPSSGLSGTFDPISLNLVENEPPQSIFYEKQQPYFQINPSPPIYGGSYRSTFSQTSLDFEFYGLSTFPMRVMIRKMKSTGITQVGTETVEGLNIVVLKDETINVSTGSNFYKWDGLYDTGTEKKYLSPGVYQMFFMSTDPSVPLSTVAVDGQLNKEDQDSINIMVAY